MQSVLFFRIKQNLSAVDSARILNDAHHRPYGDAFSATGFTHQAEGTAIVYTEADPVQRFDNTFVGVEIGYQIN